MHKEIKDKNGTDGLEAPSPLGYLKRVDWTGFLFVVLIGVFCTTAVTLYFFPIYPDEIQVRFALSRLFYDFPTRSNGFPTCLSSFHQLMPVTMYVPALINWILHGMIGNVVPLRLVGLAIAFFWLAGLAIYLNKRIGNGLRKEGCIWSPGRQALYVAGFMIAVFSVGVFPFFLISNRAEQLMLPAITLLIAISIASKRVECINRGWKKLCLIGLYFIAVSLILFGACKGLFFTPLFLIVYWQLLRSCNTSLLSILGSVLLGAQIGQAFCFVQQSLQCSESPYFVTWLQKSALNPMTLLHDPGGFLNQVYHSIVKSPRHLLELGFQEHTCINYLPSIPLGLAAKLANIFIYLNIATLFFALLFFVPFQYYRKDLSQGRFVTVNSVLGVLLAIALLSAIFTLTKTWYDAGYFYALLLIIMVFFVGENFAWIFKKAFVRRILFYLGAVALLSQVVFIHRYLPAFLKGYEGPGISIAKYDSRKVCDNLTAASQVCGIDPVNSQKVAVDFYTYLFFRKTKWPMPITYMGLGLGGDFKSPGHFLTQVDSDGLVMLCDHENASYQKIVKRVGNVCCVSKNDLKKL